MATNSLEISPAEDNPGITPVLPADAMLSFNKRWGVVWAVYVLLMPLPFIGPDFVSLGLVLIHAASFVFWIKHFRKRSQGGVSVVRQAYWSGLWAYGLAAVLIAFQARSIVQDLLILNPYFIAPLWSELVVALFWFVAFVAIAKTSDWMSGSEASYALLPLFFWGLLLTPLTLFYPIIEPLVSHALFAEPKTQIRADDIAIDDATKELADVEVWELFRLACLENFQPSEPWSESFEEFLKRDGAWWAVHRFVQSEPQFEKAINHHLKRKYDLDGEIDSKLALETLQRLGQEDTDVRSWLGVEHVVELVAPHVDHSELIEELTNAKQKDWPRITSHDPELRFDWYVLPRKNQLKPFIYAAWLLDRELNLEQPEVYNQFENTIGRRQFRQDPPSRKISNSISVMKNFFIPTEDRSGFENLMEAGALELEKYRQPILGCHEVDQHILRKWRWSLGSEYPLGSTTVRMSEYEMLFLDSLGGRKWRQQNRNRILELAKTSIEPPSKRPSKSKNSDASIAMGAVASVLNIGANREPWPIPSHLNFLFLDHAHETKPSVAMEFWPTLDSSIDKIEKLGEVQALAMKWNYLARMWPESTTEMFVDSYRKSPVDSRQAFLIGTYTNWISMPETIPVASQLEILLELKNMAAQNDASIKGAFLPYRSEQTANEMETIDYAIARLDCPLGAETLLKIWKPSYFLQFAQATTDDFDSYRRMKWTFAIAPHFYRPNNRKWREDRFNVLIDHEDPKYRICALRLIQHRPIPRYMRALKVLENDEDLDVRERALEVNEYLNGLLEKQRSRALGEPNRSVASEAVVK